MIRGITVHLLLTLSLVFLSSCYAFAQSKINPFTGKPDLVGGTGSGSYTDGQAQAAAGWVDSGTTVRLNTSTDNVGIGTSSSTYKLYVFNGNIGIGTSGNKLLLNGRGSGYQSEVFTTADTANTGTDALYIVPPVDNGRIFLGRSGKVAYALNLSNTSNIESMPILNMGGKKIGFDSSGVGTTYQNILAASSGGGTIHTGYWGVEIRGNSQALDTSSTHYQGAGNASLSVVAGQSSTIGQIIYGRASQAANLLEFRNSSFTGLSAFSASGNLGIGSLSPGKQIDVVGTVRATYFQGDGSLLTGISGGTGGWTTDSSTKTTTTYNVGISSVNPTSALDVNGTIKAISLQGQGTSAGSLQLNEATANGSSKITISAPSSLSADRTCTLEDDSTPFDGCISSVSGGWTDGTNVVTLTTSTDNVGIGTASPEKSLVVSKSAASEEGIKVKNSNASGTAQLLFANDGADVAFFNFNSSGNGAFANDLYVGNDAGELVFEAAGNMGINSSSPGATLDVAGNVRSTASFLKPTDSPGTCNTAAKGTIYYDASLSEMCDCDGSSWAQVDGGGAC